MRSGKHAAFLLSALVVLVADQLGKLHATTTLEVGSRAPLAGDWLALTHVPAMGGALGVFQNGLSGVQLIGFVALSLGAGFVIVYFFRGLAPGERSSASALGVMLGGITSHAVDRLRYGSGLDFLHLGPVTSNAVPDFSLADAALVLGAATLIVELLASEMTARAAERADR